MYHIQNSVIYFSHSINGENASYHQYVKYIFMYVSMYCIYILV